MPVLILVAGPAGSGKTTLGQALADRMHLPVADFDVVTAPIVASFRGEHPTLDEPTALANLRDDRYRVLAAHVRGARAAAPGTGLVAAAPFTAELTSSQAWSRWVRAAGWPPQEVRTVILVLDPAERYRRMAGRGASRDTAVLASGPVDLSAAAEPVIPHLRVDASLPTGEQVDQLISQLDHV